MLFCNRSSPVWICVRTASTILLLHAAFSLTGPVRGFCLGELFLEAALGISGDVGLFQ